MKTCIIIPTIRDFKQWKVYRDNFKNYGHDYDVLIIGELDNYNEKNIPEGEFWGVREREKWFNEKGLGAWFDVIPERCHAETSFGIILAYSRKVYDMVVMIDDDTLPRDNVDFLGTHWENLNSESADVVNSTSNWLNSIDPYNTLYYPRGFPYHKRLNSHFGNCKSEIVKEKRIFSPGSVVISQGLWQEIPDFNGLDYLNWNVKDICVPIDFVAEKGNWLTVCSMNLAFRPEVAPAFYQLPMNQHGIDRFDDIWSGLFVKKVCDTLGKYVITGNPLCDHHKFTRNIFNDIRMELKGLEINEKLYLELERIELTSENYLDLYEELSNKIVPTNFEGHEEYLSFLKEKMLKWCKIFRKIS